MAQALAKQSRPRGEDMSFMLGNTHITIISPKDLTDADREQVLKDFHNTGWAILEDLHSKGIEV